MATDDLPDLADFDELMELLGPVDEDKAAQALANASRRFRGAVRHPVSHVEDDEVRLEGGGRFLLLPAIPVTSIESVEVDGETVTDFDWSADGILYRARGWPKGLRSVKVVYSHGYEEIPGEIQEVVLDRARYLFSVTPGVSMMQVGSQMVQTPVGQGGSSVTWEDVVAAFQINRGETA